MESIKILDSNLKKDNFASNEEWWFYNWALEAIEIGIVSNLKYQPWTMQLAKKEHTKIPAPTPRKPKNERKVTLFQACTYTPDFILQVQPMNNPLLNQNLIPIMGLRHPSKPDEIYRYLPSYLGDVLIIEIKGTYSLKHKSDQTFPILRKWAYYHSGIFVNKVVPKIFFKKTWCPAAIRITDKTKKVSTTWIDYPTKEDYIKTNDVIKFETSPEISNEFIRKSLQPENKADENTKN